MATLLLQTLQRAKRSTLDSPINLQQQEQAERNRLGSISTMATISFECTVCLEERTDPKKDVRHIECNAICPQCALTIPPLFEKALKNEIDYPPRWGNIAIEFEDFMDMLPPEFERAWRKKVAEYETPIGQRLFCPQKLGKLGSEESYDICNSFLGDCKVIKEKVARCGKCRGHVCVTCRDPVDRPHSDHVCAAPRQEQSMNPETKGKEWQRCPYAACGIPVELRDGCNAMVCSCGTEFCFLCGEETGDDHFVAGKPCPRFGTLENGIFDPPAPRQVAIALPEDVNIQNITPEQFNAIMVNALGILVEGNHIFFDPPLNDQNTPIGQLIVSTVLDMVGALDDADDDDDDAENADANLQVDPAFTANADDREFAGLTMDILDFLTISTQLEQEISEMTEGQQRVPQVLTDMRHLADDLLAQMWQVSDAWDAARAPGGTDWPEPIEEALQITNFGVRHQRIADMIDATLPAALGVVGPGSVLARFDGMAISQRYFELYEPRFADIIEEVLLEQGARRAIRRFQLRGGN